MNMSQTIQERQKIISVWETSKWFPKDLLFTAGNKNALRAELNQLPELSVTLIVEVVKFLREKGRLQFAPPLPVQVQIVEVEVQRVETSGERRDRLAAQGIQNHRTEFDRVEPQAQKDPEIALSELNAQARLKPDYAETQKIIRNYTTAWKSI